MKRLGLISLMMVTIMMMGCDGASSGATQYTLNVTANVAITPTAGTGASVKLETPTPQVMIGAVIVEVQQNTAQELGVELFSLDLTPEDDIGIDLQIILDPQATTNGVIYKLDPYDIPYGISYLNLDLQVNSATETVEFEESTNITLRDGQTIVIGGLQATADSNDRTQLPILSDIPVINFLFQGEQHQAQITDLIVILTPQIIADTE